MFEDDGLTCVFILGLILLVCTHSFAQETCKHCPTAAEMDQQFPEAPTAHPKVFTKPFIAAELIHASAISLDAYATASREGSRCLEGHNGFAEYEHGKELALDGAVEFGASFTLTALLKWAGPPKHFGWTPYLIPAYGTALHARGAALWYQRCQ